MTGGEYSVTCPKLEEQIAKLKASPEVTQRELTAAMGSSVRALESNVRSAASSIIGVTGNYAHGWRSNVEVQSPTSIVGRVASTIKSVYPAVIEFGRRPGAKPPPVSALVEWVKVKLGATEQTARNVAFLVARAIGRRGLKPRKVLFGAWEDTRATFTRNFEAALKRITDSMVVR
jgi:hypothetical protein